MITASCHCGALKMEMEAAPESVTACNCSICRRLGALWAYYRRDQVKMTPVAGATRPYVWGARMLAFHGCRRCGCVTHWQSLDGSLDRMAVNARMFDDLDPTALKQRLFDGADTWAYLNEA